MRIDNIPPQSDIDALDMVGFVNNNSDMRSTGCCGLHIGAGIWTGNICVSGSYARSWNLRPVAKGDVLVLEAREMTGKRPKWKANSHVLTEW